MEIETDAPGVAISRQPKGISWRKLSLWIAFAAAVAVGVFVLPWYGPRPRPADSLSCRYGFNNFIAWVWVALMLGVATLYRLFRGRVAATSAMEIALSGIVPSAGKRVLDRPLLVSFLAVLAITLAVVIGWFAYLPYAYFGETKLFISRIEAMVMGLAPYRDFNFTYGPALLYLPYSVYRTFEGRFSIEQVYGFALAVNWSAGLYLAYYIVSRLSGSFARTIVFLLLVVPCLNISLGLNYTLLRFTLPMASLIALHRYIQSKVQGPKSKVIRTGSSGEDLAVQEEEQKSEDRGQKSAVSGQRSEVSGQWSVVAAALAALLVPLINFSVSPEMGMAAWLGCVAYFVHLWFTPLRRLSVCIIAVLAALPAVRFALSRAYFDSIFSFSGGGLNLPLFPTLHIIFFLLAVFCVLPALASLALKSRDVTGSMAIALCVVTGLLIVPALGRCDAGHLLLNGFGIFLLFFAALYQARPLAFRSLAIVFGIAWGVLGFATTYFQYEPIVKMATKAHGDSAGFPQTAGNGVLHYSKMQFVPADYRRLLAYEKIGLPVGTGEELERYLKLHDKFAPDHRLAPCPDIFVQAQVDQKLADMRSMKYIVVPSLYWQLQKEESPEVEAKACSEFLSRLLLFPVKLRPHAPVFVPNAQIADYITAHYRLIAKVTDLYVLMERKDEEAKHQ
ncbi:MAG: hypothetical protein C5B50_11295 [Verrucomicrobia bacterium]|nr:MAG: hypothetical protein C5B50_11295 [Verrucomicrobiota bacterium]